jgi:hypothetical protein
MRRHHTVHRCQGGDYRNAKEHLGRALGGALEFKLARNAEYQGKHNRETNLKEHRNADDEGGERRLSSHLFSHSLLGPPDCQHSPPRPDRKRAIPRMGQKRNHQRQSIQGVLEPKVI